MDACEAHGVSPFERPTVAVGGATATELIRRGFVDVRAAAGRGGEALAELCAAAGLRRIGLPCAETRHAGFERGASEQGIDVLTLPVYRLLEVPRSAAEIPSDLDAILFTSPSAVTAWARVTGGDASVPAVAIGVTTGDALRAQGHERVVLLPRHTPRDLIEAVLHGVSS